MNARRHTDGGDPVNPAHYAGRACADVGERLTANGYQVLKYSWRLGRKDDAVVELGKAEWYALSERKLLRKHTALRFARGTKAGGREDRVGPHRPCRRRGLDRGWRRERIIGARVPGADIRQQIIKTAGANPRLPRRDRR